MSSMTLLKMFSVLFSFFLSSMPMIDKVFIVKGLELAKDTQNHVLSTKEICSHLKRKGQRQKQVIRGRREMEQGRERESIFAPGGQRAST